MLKKLETAQSFVYTLMDKLGPIKDTLVKRDNAWEELKLEELVENLRPCTDRNRLPEYEIGISSDQTQCKKRSETSQDWRTKRDKMLFVSTQNHKEELLAVYTADC